MTTRFMAFALFLCFVAPTLLASTKDIDDYESFAQEQSINKIHQIFKEAEAYDHKSTAIYKRLLSLMETHRHFSSDFPKIHRYLRIMGLTFGRFDTFKILKVLINNAEKQIEATFQAVEEPLTVIKPNKDLEVMYNQAYKARRKAKKRMRKQARNFKKASKEIHKYIPELTLFMKLIREEANIEAKYQKKYTHRDNFFIILDRIKRNLHEIKSLTVYDDSKDRYSMPVEY